MSDKIQVAIKVRPLVARERDSMEYWKTRGKEIILVSSDGISAPSESYKFDYVFGKSATNFEVFEEVVKPLVDRAVKGFNATIFAYGQTSSGKTHTMLGDNQEVGIIQLVVSSMFDFMALSEGREFLVRASYMEIYNERVNDLLEQQNSNLKIREEDGRVVVSRLKEELVADTTKVMNLLKRGQKIRRIGETNLNERSSRSHTIFRMIIESRLSDDGEDGTIQVSQLNLVDLAGSERAGLSGATGDRLKEGCAINRSLFQLSQVVSQLSEGHQFVNFRDSKLTRILQPSLGGNAHTLIICTVTPASVEFTQSTLGFALRAKSVKNKPQVNEVMSDGTLLKKYARQLEKLQTELKAAKERNPTDELEAVESKLEEQERINSELQQRINNLMKSLIVSKPKAKNQRPNRRRTWGGGKSFDFLSQRFSSLVSIPEMPTIDTSLVMDADDFEFNTPYEDFEVQLIEDEREKCEELTSELLSVSRMSYSGTSNTRSSWNGNDDACIQTSPEIRDTLLRESASGSRTPHEVLYSRISTLEKEWSELESFTKRENDIIEELENELKLKEEMCLQLQNKLSEKEGILVETLNLQESLTHKLIEYEAALQKNKKVLDSCQKPKEVEALELQVEELRMNISESNKQMTSCKRKLYNEVISLNPNCKNKITENSEPSEMLNVLMACIMEKEMEMLQYVQTNQGVSSESPTKCNLTRSCSLKPEKEFSGNDGEKAFEWLDLIQQIQDLEHLKESQEGTINNLQESKEKQEDTIKTLHETNKKQEETIKTLQETKEKQEEAIKTLQEIKEKQEETVKYLHETNEKQEETIKNLYETNKKQEQTIKNLYETNTKQEETIKDLHNSKVCVENELTFLRNDMIKIQDNISMESEKNQAYLKEIQQKLNLAESELILHEKIVKEFQKQKNERDEIYRECEDLRVKTESLERMLNELREENESLKDKLSSETVQQAEMTTQIVTLTNKCSDEENYISTYLQQIKQLENSLAESNKEKNKVCAEIELLQNWKQECEELMRQSDEERKALENKIIVLECSRILPEKENNQLSFSHFSNNEGCLNQTRGSSNIEDNQVKPDVLISNTIVNDKELMKTPDAKMVDDENIDKKNIQTLEEIVIDQEQKILNLHLQLETLESQIQQDATIKEQMQHQIEHLEKIKLDYELNNKEEYDVKLSLVSTIDTMEAKLKDQEKLVKHLKSEQDMQKEDSNIKIGEVRDLQRTPENTKDTTSHEGILLESNVAEKVIVLEEELKNARTQIRELEMAVREKDLLQSECSKLQPMICEQKESLNTVTEMNSKYGEHNQKPKETNINQELIDLSYHQQNLKEKDLENQVIALEEELRSAKSLIAQFEKVLQEKELLESECHQLQQAVSEQKESLQCMADMNKGLEQKINKRKQEYSEFEDQESSVKVKDVENKVIALEEELSNAKSRTAEFEKVLQEKELLDSKCHQLQQLVSEQRDTLQSLEDMKKSPEADVNNHKQEYSEFKDQEPRLREKDLESKIIALEEELRKAVSHVADFENVLEEKESLRSQCQQLQRLVSEQRDTLQSLADMKKGLEEEVKKRKQECSEFEDQEPCVKEKDLENKIIALEEELRNAKTRVADFEKVLQEKELLDSKCHQLQQLVSEQRDTLQSLEDMKKSPEEDVNKHEQEYSEFKDQEPCLREKDLESKIIALEEELRKAISHVADFENVLEEKESLRSQCQQLQRLVSEQRDTLQSLADMKKGLEEEVKKRKQECSEFEDQEPCVKEKDFENKVIALEEELRNAKSRVADFEKVLQEKELLDSKCHQLQQLVSEQRDTLQSLEDMKKSPEEDVNKHEQEYSEFKDQEPRLREKDLESKIIALEEELRKAISHVADFENVLEEKESLRSECQQLQRLVSEQRDTLQSIADMKKGLEDLNKQEQECSEFEDHEPCVKEKDFENKVIALEEELRNAKSRVADFENVLEEKESLQSECHQLQQLVSEQRDTLQSLEDMKKSPEADVNNHKQEYSGFKDQEPRLREKDLESKIIALEEELRKAVSHVADFENVLEEKESLRSECQQLQQLVSEQRDTLQSLADMKKGLEDLNKQEQECSEFEDHEPCVKEKDFENKVIALQEELRNAKTRVADFEKVLLEKELLDSKCHQLQQLVSEQRDTLQSLEDMKKSPDFNNHEQEYSEFKGQEPRLIEKDLESKIIALEEELRKAVSHVADFENVLEEKESLRSECQQLQQLVSEQRDTLQSLEDMKKGLEEDLNKQEQEYSVFEDQVPRAKEKDLENEIIALEEELRNAKSRVADFENVLEEKESLQSECHQLQQLVSQQKESLQSLADMKSPEDDVNTHEQQYPEFEDQEPCLKQKDLENKIIALEEELRNSKSGIAQLEKVLEEKESLQSECNQLQQLVFEQRESIQSLEDVKKGSEEDVNKQEQEYSEFKDQEPCVKGKDLEIKIIALEEELRNAKSRVAEFEKVLEEKESLQSECNQLQQLVLEQKESLQSLENMKKSLEDHVNNCRQKNSEFEYQEASVEEKDLEKKVIGNDLLHSKCSELRQVISDQGDSLSSLAETNRLLQASQQQDNATLDNSDISYLEGSVKHAHLESKVGALEEELRNAKSRIAELEREVGEVVPCLSECCRSKREVSDQKLSLQTLNPTKNILEEHFVDDLTNIQDHSQVADLEENVKKIYLEQPFTLLEEELRSAKSHIASLEKIVEEKELLQSECCKLRQIVSEQKLSLQSLDAMKRKFEEDLSNCVKACVYSEISHEENVKEKDLENHLIILEEEFRNSKLKIAELEKIVQEKELLQSEERGVVQVLPQTNSLRSSFEMRCLLEERNENNEREDQSGVSRAEEVLEDKYLEKRIFVLEEELKNAKSKITELERIVEEKELIQSECCKLLHTISEQKESIQSLVAVERKLDQQLLVDDEHVSLVHSEFSTLCENLLRERKDLEKSIVVLKEELRNAKIHLEEFEKKYEVEVKRKEELSDNLDDLQSALQISAEKCHQLQKEMSQLEKNYNTQEKQNNTKMHELESVNITLENKLMAESKLKSDKELEITYLKKALNDKKNEISLVLEEAKHLEDRLNHEIILKTELEKNLHESQKLKNDVENKLKIVIEENMLLQNKLEDVSNCVTEQEKTFQTLKELKDKLEKKLLSQTDYDDIKKGFGELQLQFVEESNAKESLSKRLCAIERELNECKCSLQKVHSEKLELERSCQVFQDQVQEKERALAMTKIELETLTSKSENCGELQTELERLQNSLQAQENKLLNFIEERNSLKEGIKQYTIQLQDLQCEMEILKNDKLNCERKLDNALKDMFILQAKYDSFQENHDKLENCLKDILGPDLISVNQQCEGNILDAIKELKFQYNNALKRKEILENSVQYLENELSEVKKQLCEVQEDNVGLTKKLSMEEELHSQIKILEKTNEGCKERIDTLFQHKMELQKDLDNIQIKVNNQKEEISSLNQEIENLKNQVEHYSILISEKEQSIDDLQSQKSKCDEKLKEMMEDHKCLVSKIHYLENVSVLQEATSEELDRAKCDLAKVIESLKDTVSLENHNNLKVQLENQMKVNRDLQNEIQYLRQFVEEQEQKCIAKCALSNEKLENMVKEKEMLMDMVKNLKKTCEEKELRIQQTEKVKETLSNEIDRLQFVTTEKEKTIHSLERSRHLEDHLLKQSELHDENLIMSLKQQLSEETRMKSELEKKLQVVQGELTEAKNLQEQSTESHVNYLTEIVRKQLLDICARDQEIKSIKSFLAGHLFRFFGNSVETSRSVMENLQCIVSELKKEGRPMGGKEREKLQNKIKSLEEQVASLKNTLKEEGYEYEAPYWVRKGNWAISNRKMRQLEKTVKELEQEIAILRQQNSPEESFMDCTLLAAGLSAPASNKFGCSKCKDFEEQLNKLKEELGGKNLCINALTARLDCKDSVSKKKIETLQEEVSSLKGENKHLQDFIGIYQEQLKKHQTTKYSQSTQTDPKFPSWESVRCLGSGSKIVNDHAAEVNTRKLVKLEEENEKLKRLVLDLRKRINQQDKEDKKVDQPLPSRQTRQTVVSSPRRRAALDRLIRDADQTLEQRRQPWPCVWKPGEKENSQARSSQKQDADGESSSTKRPLGLKNAKN